MKNTKKLFFMLTIFFNIYCFSLTTFAKSFKDVNPDYWAYDAIYKMSDLEIIVGDLSGNFNPENYVDKFECVKIFAKFLKATNKDLENKNNLYYDNVYFKYKNIINKYSKSFKRWNSTADKDIALLLDKNVLFEGDLGKFIIKDEKNDEYIKSLSREELAEIFAKILNYKKDTQYVKNLKSFSDDNLISKDKLEYVYFITNANIIDTKDGYFYPKKLVTRADLAYYLNNFLTYINNDINNVYLNNDNPKNIDNIKDKEKIVTFKKFFKEMNSVQIEDENKNYIYKLKNNFFNSNTEIEDIKENTQVKIVIENSEILKILPININKEFKSGQVFSINIAKNNSALTIKDLSDNSINQYYFKDFDEKIYNIKLDDFVIIETVDNNIKNIYKQDEYFKSKVFKISKINKDSIIIASLDNEKKPYSELYFNENTIFFDANSGKVLESSMLLEDSLVYVVYDLQSLGYLKTLIVLN